MERSINRFGLTEVFKPAGVSKVDIVFVHGINGHPFRTWTSEKDRTFWPAQLLPRFVEEAKARILVYGYDADTVSPVKEIASSDTALDRDGGIVVKRALIHSSGKKGKHTVHLRSIAVSTYGILFLGTPHLGYDRTKWASWSDDVSCTTLKNGSQARLLEALETNSETLQNIERQFVELASDFHIFYFHETKLTWLDNGWRYLVNEGSAAPVIQDVERAGIQQDHSHMCTFDNIDTPGFDLVAEAIERYATDAPEPIQRRWVIETDQQHLSLLGGITSGVARHATSKPAAQASDTLPTGDHAAIDTTNSTKPQPKKHYLVPWDCVKNFVGREAQLEKIATCFRGASTQQPRVLILYALGGQGKSQIVLEYCRLWRKDYQGVFWVNASSRSLALQSYTRIATASSSQPQAKFEDGEQIIETVKTLLEDWNESWLLIFDNYDKPDEFCDIRRFLPRDEHGHVIITSRRRDLDRLGDLMELGALSPNEGVNLLLRGYSRQEIAGNLKTAKEIISRLGGLALAIDQAGAYIAHRRVPPHQLHGFLETYETQRKEIMSYTPSHFWEYGSMQTLGKDDRTKAINAFTTWEISMKQLIKDNPRQKDAIVRFLRLSAYFNPARIEESLFRNHWAKFQSRNDVPLKRAQSRQIRNFFKRKESQASNANDTRASSLYTTGTNSDLGQGDLSHQKPEDQWDPDRFWDLLTKIHNLSLVQNIEKDTQGASFSLHPLVRDWLQHRGQLIDHQQYVAEGFGILRSTASIHLQYHTRISIDQRAALLSHIDACMLNDEHLSEPHKHLGNEETSYDTADVLAGVYYQHGRYDSAENLMIRITKNENAHIIYFTKLSQVLTTQVKHEQVVELSHRCQQYRENTLNERHPDRLAFTSVLSSALLNLGRYDEAESLQWKTLRLQQEVLGQSHGNTLESMSDLAYSLYRQTKFEESEALAREALQLCESNLPKNDETTLRIMEVLALVLRSQSRFDEAEVIQRRLVVEWQQSLGIEHPVTLIGMHNLAWILESTKKDEAAELYRHVVQRKKKVLRKGHPNTLNSMGSLADLLRESGRDEEADEIKREIADFKRAAEGVAEN
ncbi:MAG: hypothetical protein L6R42_001169 [Xanthoria sp. 1 TBL-2021]|nr:MAG: hypothetical protein L6R42_001169 [Xanthoria sp. 1 TBL-2021]